MRKIRYTIKSRRTISVLPVSRADDRAGPEKIWKEGFQMRRFFDMESPFFRFLSRMADIMILNLLFLLTCIPIVTIGASWTALYYVTLKMVRNEESYIVRGYFKSFKENFKQATIMWLIVLVFLVVLFLDFRILSLSEGKGINFMTIGITVVALVGAMVLTYLFPILAKFYNTIKRTFLNAFLMSVRHLPQTVIMIVIPVAAVYISVSSAMVFAYATLMWIMLGFALIAYCNSWFLVRIFDRYIPQENEENAAEDGKDADAIAETENAAALEAEDSAVSDAGGAEETPETEDAPVSDSDGGAE